jgi:hypothetical protein
VTTTIATRGAPPSATATDRRSFERWGVPVYLLATAVLVVAIVTWLGGTFVYVLDDAAIHLSVADTLIHHGTWGVSAGSFESASSSPLWTLLVAGGMLVAPVADQWVPLVLNVAAGAAVVVILGRSQDVLRPSRRRPFDVVAVAVLVTVVLFLPGLAVVGMEHTLHMALVLGAVVLIARPSPAAGSDPVARAVPAALPGWVGYALLALATLTRFETAFVGAGLAAGLAAEAVAHRRVGPAAARRIVAVVAAVAVPLGLFAAVNRALGGGLLPNSVLVKGNGTGTAVDPGGIGPGETIGRLTSDPLLVAIVVFAIGYIALTWRRSDRHLVAAVTVVVATLLHASLADVGWFERYQAYLIALGVYLALAVLGDVPPAERGRGLAALVAVAVLLTPAKALLLLRAPQWADNMYRHTYQAGLFLEEYYDGQPVATDQLGYITLFHDGPVTDFGGLGDYEVLRRVPDRAHIPEFRAQLAEERGFHVAVLPAVTSAFAVPDTWVLGGILRIEGPYQGLSRDLDVWATSPDDVAALQDHLRDFEPRLPDRVTLVMNDYADLQASRIRAREAAEADTPP